MLFELGSPKARIAPPQTLLELEIDELISRVTAALAVRTARLLVRLACEACHEKEPETEGGRRTSKVKCGRQREVCGPDKLLPGRVGTP